MSLHSHWHQFKSWKEERNIGFMCFSCALHHSQIRKVLNRIKHCVFSMYTRHVWQTTSAVCSVSTISSVLFQAASEPSETLILFQTLQPTQNPLCWFRSWIEEKNICSLQTHFTSCTPCCYHRPVNKTTEKIIWP